MYQLVSSFSIPASRRSFTINYIKLTGELLSANIDYTDDDGIIGIWKNSKSKHELHAISSYLRLIGQYLNADCVGSVEVIPDPIE